MTRSRALANRKQSRSLDRSLPLITHWTQERWYIAIHENGYGVHNDVAKAILLAQESVALRAKPKQLVIFEADTQIEPTGYITWPNGVQPRLVGLTNTHQGWMRRK